MGVVDVHAHYVAKSLLEMARSNGAEYGVRVHESPGGAVLEFLHDHVKLRPLFPQLMDLELRKEYMHQEGITQQIVSTWTDIIPADMPAPLAEKWVRLQNDTLIADVNSAGDHVRAMGTLPLQDPGSAIRELKYLTEEMDVHAIELLTSVAGRDLDAQEFRPLWREITDRDVFVLLHPPRCPFEGGRSDPYFLNNLVFFPTDTTVAAAKLIFSGIMREFPTLKICLPHAGGFLPYQIGRFDHGYDVHPACRTSISELPSQYLRSFYYDTITHDDAAFRFLVDRVGSDRILYGTDYPFEMTDTTGLYRVQSLKTLSGADRDQISHINAHRVLSTVNSKLQPLEGRNRG